MDAPLDMIRDLAAFERWAEEFYRGAAQLFRHDPETAMFLEEQALEEAWHFQVAESLAAFFTSDGGLCPPVAITDEARLLIAQPVEAVLGELRAGGPSHAALSDRIIGLEFSEWNILFLWAINRLQGSEKSFKKTAIRLQRHLRDLICFLERHPLSRSQRERIGSLPTLWREKILVVDDDPVIRQLLEMILQDEGTVETADNGRSGLEKVRENYYALIVSDIDMPGMDGLSFYREAAKDFGSIGDRFLFFSGAVAEDRASFLKERRISCLPKPVPLGVIREQAQLILNRGLSAC
jgi:CheY-like chemotaxis protein